MLHHSPARTSRFRAFRFSPSALPGSSPCSPVTGWLSGYNAQIASWSSLCFSMSWWMERGSNPRPSGYEPAALPTELPIPAGRKVPSVSSVKFFYVNRHNSSRKKLWRTSYFFITLIIENDFTPLCGHKKTPRQNRGGENLTRRDAS